MKRTIPKPNEDQLAFNRAVKENLDIITGRSVMPIQKLDSTATLSDVISKINELLDRIQQ